MKKLLLVMSLLISMMCAGMLAVKLEKPAQQERRGFSKIIDRMPIVEDHPMACYGSGIAPFENRSETVRKWLAPSLKISVSRASGSGTIVFFNPEDGYAYVQSCGHLWNGNMSAEEGKTRKIECQVITWYHNEKKLESTKTYKAEVLWYCNTRGKDSSLLRFKPDWVPNCFPIAKAGYPLPKGTKLHSCGCDGGREVAHYDVEVVGEQNVGSRPLRNVLGQITSFADPGEWTDLVTKNNSPRPGRSGGGLMSEDGFYVGICWGTSDVSGNGIGLFTPLSTIRLMNEQEGYGWLNDAKPTIDLPRRIPIVDRNNPQKKWPGDYIPLPGGR